MARPPIDVVVPFAGSQLPAFSALELRDGDTLTVVDNRPAGEAALAGAAGPMLVVRAPERQSSYYARNRGAAPGSAPWIVFLDADVRPAAGLLDAYFDEPPGERVGVLAGGISDEGGGVVGERVARHASLGQENTLARGYAQTANLAVRREAFEAVGGFTDDIRSGGDADLCFRLTRAGWALEARPGAAVGHTSRSTLRALAGQQARQGAGAAWLEERYPGTFPARPVRPLAVYFVREALHFDRARLVGPTAELAFELGRRLSNRAPEGRRRWTPLESWLR